MLFSFRTALKFVLGLSICWDSALGRVGRHMEQDRDEQSIICRLWQVDVLYADATNVPSQSYDCIENDVAYGLELTSDAPVEEASGSQIAVRGIKDDANARIVVLAEGDAPMIALAETPLHSRRLAKTTGTSRVLVLRVNYRGAEPSLSASQLAGRIFGLGQKTVGTDMALQFSRCSFGKLKMKPFNGSGVTDGVAEIKITQKVAGSNVKVLQNLVFEEARRLVRQCVSFPLDCCLIVVARVL